MITITSTKKINICNFVNSRKPAGSGGRRSDSAAPAAREKTGKNYLKISCNNRKHHAIIAPLSVQTALLRYILYIIFQSVQDLHRVTVVNHFVM